VATFNREANSKLRRLLGEARGSVGGMLKGENRRVTLSGREKDKKSGSDKSQSNTLILNGRRKTFKVEIRHD